MIRISELRRKLLFWLAADLIAELNRQRWLLEGIHDLHIVLLHYDEATVEMAFQNARALEPDLMAGRISIQDRQASLVEVFRRQNHG